MSECDCPRDNDWIYHDAACKAWHPDRRELLRAAKIVAREIERERERMENEPEEMGWSALICAGMLPLVVLLFVVASILAKVLR